MKKPYYDIVPHDYEGGGYQDEPRGFNWWWVVIAITILLLWILHLILHK